MVPFLGGENGGIDWGLEQGDFDLSSVFFFAALHRFLFLLFSSFHPVCDDHGGTEKIDAAFFLSSYYHCSLVSLLLFVVCLVVGKVGWEGRREVKMN